LILILDPAYDLPRIMVEGCNSTISGRHSFV
jgi:hypothetical protein